MLLTLLQVLQGLGFMAFMIAWTVYAVNIASMGEYSTSTYAAGPIKISVSERGPRRLHSNISHSFILRSTIVSFRFDRLNSRILSRSVAGICCFASFGQANSSLHWVKSYSQWLVSAMNDLSYRLRRILNPNASHSFQMVLFER